MRGFEVHFRYLSVTFVITTTVLRRMTAFLPYSFLFFTALDYLPLQILTSRLLYSMLVNKLVSSISSNSIESEFVQNRENVYKLSEKSSTLWVPQFTSTHFKCSRLNTFDWLNIEIELIVRNTIYYCVLNPEIILWSNR